MHHDSIGFPIGFGRLSIWSLVEINFRISTAKCQPPFQRAMPASKPEEKGGKTCHGRGVSGFFTQLPHLCCFFDHLQWIFFAQILVSIQFPISTKMNLFARHSKGCFFFVVACSRFQSRPLEKPPVTIAVGFLQASQLPTQYES